MTLADTPTPPARRRSRALRWLGWTGVALALLIMGVLIAFNVSPRPGTRLIRYVFEKDAADKKRAMEAYLDTNQPARVISSLTDQPYRPGDDDTRLDVYFHG